jgi:hypothetical protein
MNPQFFLNHYKESNMPKSHNAHRDAKKKPMMTPKEKRTAKHAKKHSHDVQPLITPTTH